MQIEQMGEEFFLISEISLRIPARLARVLNEELWPGITEVTGAYESLGIYGNPSPGWEHWLQDHLNQFVETAAPEVVHHIPVSYSRGLDFLETCQETGLEPETLIALHTEKSYTCYAVGFCPGFAYLGYLDPKLHRGRRESPRVKVPKGSVGIALGQTAVYPSETPGGWNLIGQTPLELVCEHDQYFPIQAGDQVRFFAIGDMEFETLKGQRL